MKPDFALLATLSTSAYAYIVGDNFSPSCGHTILHSICCKGPIVYNVLGGGGGGGGKVIFLNELFFLVGGGGEFLPCTKSEGVKF